MSVRAEARIERGSLQPGASSEEGTRPRWGREVPSGCAGRKISTVVSRCTPSKEGRIVTTRAVLERGWSSPSDAIRESGSKSSSDAESPKGGHVVTGRDNRKRVAGRTAET